MKFCAKDRSEARSIATNPGTTADLIGAGIFVDLVNEELPLPLRSIRG
jgi:hypothetical protein